MSHVVHYNDQMLSLRQGDMHTHPANEPQSAELIGVFGTLDQNRQHIFCRTLFLLTRQYTERYCGTPFLTVEKNRLMPSPRRSFFSIRVLLAAGLASAG